MAEHSTVAVTVAEEPLGIVQRDAEVLFRRHWREVATHRDAVPLDIDWTLYRLLAEAKILRIWCARDGRGELVGYCAWFVRTSHPHYRSTAWAQNDVFYVEPGARGAAIGKALLEASLAGMRPAEGRMKVQIHAKVTHDFQPLAEACGFRWIEKIYERLI